MFYSVWKIHTITLKNTSFLKIHQQNLHYIIFKPVLHDKYTVDFKRLSTINNGFLHTNV